MTRDIRVKLIGDSRSVEKAFKRAGNSADKFHKKLGKLSKRGAVGGRGIRGLGRAAGIGGLGAGGAAGAGILIGASSIKAAVGFEKTMARVQGLAGQSQKQVKRWSDQLIGLGPALGKTPQELAEALYFIASSGVPASKAIDVLSASAKASAAGLGETEVVADAVTSVMNAYAKSGMTAAQATDTLVAIVREGKGEADAFAGVIGNVAAFSSRLNVPFEQMGAALAAMTQLGTDPRTASTQLMAFYSQILKVSEPMQKKAKRLGLGDIFTELQDALVKGDLLGALKRLRGLDPLALAQIFPNVRAVRAALALVEEGGGRVEGIFRRMTNTSGSMGKAFATASKTSAFNFEKFKAAIEALKIAFGQGLLPAVTKVAIALGKKLADPKFVERVRELGRVIGQKILAFLRAVGRWFDEHWPGIKSGLQTAAGFARGLADAFQRLANIVPGGAKTLIGVILSGLLLTKILGIVAVLKASGLIGGAGLGGKGKGAKGKGGGLGGFGAGLKGLGIGLGLAGAGQEIPGGGSLILPGEPGWNPKQAKKRGKARGKVGGRYSPGRQHGGWVVPGVGYRVTDREMFIPSGSGHVVNGAGGGPVHIHVHVGSKKVAQAILPDLERLTRQTAGSRRGRFGGQNLALG